MTIGHGHYRGKRLYANYGHLEKIFVSVGDKVKRGQVIGLAVDLPERFRKLSKYLEPHLHFEVFHLKERFDLDRDFQNIFKPGVPKDYYNPDNFWLGGEPQCFDRDKDYSNYTDIDFTHPVACGKYGKIILREFKNN